MSTKIYNGYMLKFSSTMPIFGMSVIQSNLRESAMEIADEIATRHIAGRAAMIVDHWAAGLALTIDGAFGKPREPTGLDYPRALAWLEAQSRAAAVKGDRRRFDLSCSLVVLPQPTGEILALLYAGRDEYKQMWEESEHATPYSYWDNADMPNGMSEAEWCARGAKWEKALPGGITPAEAGMTMDLVPDGHWPIPDLDTISLAVPPFDKRVEATAIEMAIRLRERTAPIAPGDIAMGPHQWVRATDAGREAVAVNATHLSYILPKNVVTLLNKPLNTTPRAAAFRQQKE